MARGIPIAALLAASAAGAQTKTGTTIGQFMAIEPSARIAAMGNAGVAVQDAIQSIYYNPASLGSIRRPAVQFTHSFWFADISIDYVGLAVPAGDVGKFFLSATSLRSGDMDVRTVEQPLGTGERFSVENLALGFAYARDVTDRFEAGVQVNYVQETIWNSAMRTLTFSVGTLYRLSDSGILLGASLLNFGTDGQFDGRDLTIQYDNDPERYGDNSALPGEQYTGEFPVPILFRAGISFPKRISSSSRLLIVVDAQHPSDNTESLSGGWEWTWKEAFSIRAGYQNLYQQDSELGLTTGVGFRGVLADKSYQFDYAWAHHTTLAETHRLTFVLGL
jgi:long-subunit fatty acid transport protein